MASTEFADIHRSRKAHLDAMARQGKLLRPLTALVRGIFALSRGLGFEYPLFRAFFKPMTGMFDKAIDKAFRGYTPTANDVFVCAYYKSGTNWLMQVAHQIANCGEGEFDDILDVIPWADCPAPETTIPLADPRPARLSITGKRVIKTHARAQYVPYSAEARYLCVIRDPKDVVVSAHHFFGSMLLGPLIPSVETWVRHCLSKDAAFGPWSDFVASYWPWRDRPNVLFVTYEEMQDDSIATIRKIATLMDVDLNDAEVEKINRLSSFEYMKNIDHKFYPGEVTPFARPGGSMIRRGKKGSSGEMLTLDQQGSIDRYCRTRLAALGCDFPYDQYYGNRGDNGAGQ